MTVKHPVERGSEGRGAFDRLAERVSNLTSSPLFFVACAALVVAWALAYALHWPEIVHFLLGDAMGAITLALVALMKNAERRAEHAVQYKLDAIGQALLEMRRGDEDAGLEDLERAIGLHEEV